jgi:hypothetical protein
MKPILREEEFNRLIDNYKTSQSYYIYFTVGIALASALVQGSGFFFELNTPIKTAMHIGGILVLAVGAFPIKEFLSKREKINAVEILKDLLTGKREPPLDAEELQKFNDLAYNLLEKTVTI